MTLKQISSENKVYYNNFVSSQPFGAFLQSWQWGQWQEKLGRQVFRFLIFSNNKVIGSMQLIKMPLPLRQYYLYCPYGPLFKNDFPNTDYGLLLKELQQKFPDCIFIRLEPKELPATSSRLLVKTKNIQPGKTLVLDLSQTAEELQKQMHQKTRYNIRVAQKSGVEINSQFDIKIGSGFFTKEAIELIKQTARRHKFKDFSLEYYHNLINFFLLQNKGDIKVHLYKAIFQKQLLSSAIMLDYHNTRTYLFGGSAEQNKNLMAPYLLHWQAMLDAKKNNLKFYDFWGTETSSGKQPGFVRFKLGFGGSEVNYAGAYDFAFSPIKYFIYKMFRLVKKFFF